ncbi:MAG: Nif3-like dinuclear metal center hexameric protein [Clostridia bacterium]|nr:Nif3-like dinuclear metal center hexameric protein [Clostridia bacterium]
MTVREFHAHLSALYPKTLSEPWDNDGIMVSADPDVPVKRVIVALDATSGVIGYAADHGFDCVLTHHPMLFRGAKAAVPDTPGGRRILRAALGGVSVISLHTRLDAGEGGVNDCLLRQLGFENRGGFGVSEAPGGHFVGRWTEVPPMTGLAFAERVKKALGCETVRVTGDCAGLIRKIAVCGGDGKDYIPEALAGGFDAYLTGDAGYNMAEDAAEDGLFTVEAGHYHSEAPVLPRLKELADTLTNAETVIVDTCAYRNF